MKNIDVMSLSDLEQLLNDLQLNKISSDQIKVRFYIKKICEDSRENIEKFINKLIEITVWENIYVTINSRVANNYDNRFLILKQLIELVPEKIIKLKLSFENSNFDFNKLNLHKIINLKKLLLLDCLINKDIIDLLCELLRNNIYLEHLTVSSSYDVDSIYYEMFLNKVAVMLKSNRNLQTFRIDIQRMLYDIENKSYYKSYVELKNLIESNKYTPDRLIALYRDLQTYIKTAKKTQQIYDCAGEDNSIIKSAIDQAQLIIKDKKTIFDNAVQFAINNIQNNKIVAEAVFILTEELKLTDPKEAYQLLTKIPDCFKEIYRQANDSMAHILLGMDESDYKKMDLPYNEQGNKPDKMQMICSHLSESGSKNKELLDQVFHEYIFGDGLAGDDNPFKLTTIEPELFPKTSSLLFVLDAWRKNYKDRYQEVTQTNQSICSNEHFCVKSPSL